MHRLSGLLKIRQCKLQLQRGMLYYSAYIRCLSLHSDIQMMPAVLALVLWRTLQGNMHLLAGTSKMSSAQAVHWVWMRVFLLAV